MQIWWLELLYYTKMTNVKIVGAALLLMLGIAAVSISTANAQSCNTCNCQFNNFQVLSQLIEAQVNRTLANEPSKLLRIP